MPSQGSSGSATEAPIHDFRWAGIAIPAVAIPQGAYLP